MARMSSEKRIELGTAMVKRWSDRGAQSDRSVLFVQDMLVRLGRGKALTTKQRSWYDSAVLSDPPKPQNEELVNQLRQDAVLAGMERVSSVLTDFAYKLSRGWNLSEKQIAFMTKLTDKASDIRQNGRWAPSVEEKREIEIGVAFCRRYNQYYLSSSPGIEKALEDCKEWLAGNLDYVEKWSAGRMMKICKGDRAKLADAGDRWPVGSLASSKQGQFGLVIGIPQVDQNGSPSLSLLIDGVPTILPLDKMKKERRRKKKA